MNDEKLHLVIVVFQDLYQPTIMQRDGVGESYERVSARLWMSPADMDRLGVRDGDCVEVYSEIATVVVRTKTFHKCKNGIGYMPPSPYSTSLTRYDWITVPMLNLRRIEATIHKTENSITPLLALLV